MAPDLRAKASSPAEYTVVHRCVFIREGPSTDDTAIGRLFQGQVVSGCEVDGWLYLDVASTRLHKVNPPAWVLVDGQKLGLGTLLECHRPEPVDEDDAAPGGGDAGATHRSLSTDSAASTASTPSTSSDTSRVAARRKAQAEGSLFDFGALDQPKADEASSGVSPTTCAAAETTSASAERAALDLRRTLEGKISPASRELLAGIQDVPSTQRAHKGARPLLKLFPWMGESRLHSKSMQGLVVDFEAEAVTIFIGTPPGGDPYLWGDIGTLATLACGTYYPVRHESPGMFGVSMQLSGRHLSATSKAPIRVRVPEPGAPTPPDAHPPIFFLVHQQEHTREQADKFRVFNQHGIWVMDTGCLRTAAWAASTRLAEEADLRLRSCVGNVPAPLARIAPPPPPGLPDGFFRGVQVRIITLDESRNSNVQRLKESLAQVFESLHPWQPDVQTFTAWDTRGLTVATVQALCQSTVLAGRIFLSESGVLIRIEDEEEVREAAHVRASKVLGCAVSHSDLWVQLATGPSEGPWVILEDDAILNTARPFTEILTSALATFTASGRDLLLLGASSDAEEQCGYVGPCTVGPVRQFFFGFWGYVISKRGAVRALDAIWGSDTVGERRFLKGDIDCECASAAVHKRLEILACVPHLVLVTHTHSGVRRIFRPAGYEYRLHVNGDEECESTRVCADPTGEGPVDVRLLRRVTAKVNEFRRAVRRQLGPDS